MSQQVAPFHLESDDFEGQPLDAAESATVWKIFAAFLLLLTYCYGNMLIYTASFWRDPQYSHGWIVPLIAGYLFWTRRKPLTHVEDRERWIGLAILTASLLVRLYASFYDKNPFDQLSFVAAILGTCQLVGGTSMLRWAGPPLAFLVFMYPLPSAIEPHILDNLQKIAAVASEWTLQLLGVPALREGNSIMVDQIPLNIADQCSGLRMGTIFGAMAVALAMVIQRPWWDRLTILLSAIPIALITNIIRITVTALLYMAFPESEALKHYVHDWAGLAMMPIALGFLWLEFEILTRITVPIETDDYAAFGAAGPVSG
jgi:exosortase